MSDVAGKVLLGAGSKNDACRWYRMTVPATAIGEEQILWTDNVLVPGKVTLTDDEFLSLRAMVIQRQTRPEMLALVRNVVQLKSPRPKVIVELDDDLWALPTSNPAFDYYNKERLNNLGSMIKLADKVIVSTSYLADAITARFDRGVVVVPNTLPDGLDWADPATTTFKPDTLLFSGGATHGDDLCDAASSLRPLIRRNKLNMVMLGHSYREHFPGAKSLGLAKDVPDHYARLRAQAGAIGLAPLAHTTFNVSKSAIRILEYAMAGILPLATNYGPYAWKPIAHVGQHEQWFRAVARTQQLNFAEMLRLAQQWAKTRVISNYVEAWKTAWEIS